MFVVVLGWVESYSVATFCGYGGLGLGLGIGNVITLERATWAGFVLITL